MDESTVDQGNKGSSQLLRMDRDRI